MLQYHTIHETNIPLLRLVHSPLKSTVSFPRNKTCQNESHQEQGCQQGRVKKMETKVKQKGPPPSPHYWPSASFPILAKQNVANIQSD